MMFYDIFKNYSEDPNIEIVNMYQNDIVTRIINCFSDNEYEINLFQKYCFHRNGNILELACGSGRITIELAKKGFNIIGLDNSLVMINLFKENIIKSNLTDEIVDRIKIYHQDVFDYSLVDDFTNIILPATTISLLAFEYDKLLILMKNLYNDLPYDGLFIFDYLILINDKIQRNSINVEINNVLYKIESANYVDKKMMNLVFNMLAENIETGKKYLTSSIKKILNTSYVYNLIDKTKFKILDEIDIRINESYNQRFVILKK